MITLKLHDEVNTTVDFLNDDIVISQSENKDQTVQIEIGLSQLKQIIDFAMEHGAIHVEPTLEFLKRRFRELVIEKQLYFKFVQNLRPSDLEYTIMYGNHRDVELYGTHICNDDLKGVYLDAIKNIKG